MAEGIRMLLVAFPDLSVAVQRLVGEEDYVVAQVRMAGTNTGAYLRVPEPTEPWHVLGRRTPHHSRWPSKSKRTCRWSGGHQRRISSQAADIQEVDQ